MLSGSPTNSECNQEAALYPHELTSTLLSQMLSQVHLLGNTSHDYPGLQRFLSICKSLDDTLSVALHRWSSCSSPGCNK